MVARTQDDIVKQALPVLQEEVRKVLLPGIKDLHTRPATEIAEVLANVLRMERNVTKLTWTVGKYIELTVTPKL